MSTFEGTFMKRLRLVAAPLVLMVACLAFTTRQASAETVTFSWSGVEISGVEQSGSATFSLSGTVLTIVLTNTTSDQMNAIAQVLTGLTWDITDASVGLTSVSAVLNIGSTLVGTGATGDTDLSGEWAFKDNISVVGLGPFGVGAIGDINFGEDTFGEMDIINPALNLFGPAGPNGIDAGLVGFNVDLLADGFASQGPVVQNSLIFTFNVSGDLDLSEITNVQPLFGSNGVAAVPEPSPLALLGCGLLLLGVLSSELKSRGL